MSLVANQEQKEFQDSLRTFFEAELESPYLRTRMAQGAPTSEKSMWDKLLGLGLLEYFASQDADTKPGLRELSIIATETGRGLLPENIVDNILAGPYLFSSLLNADALAKTGEQNLLQRLASGGLRGAIIPAHALRSGELRFVEKGTACTLNGAARLVRGADVAGFLIAAIPGNKEEQIVLLKTSEKAVRIESEPVLDGTLKCQRVICDAAPCVKLGSSTSAPLTTIVTVLRAAEMAGACARAVHMTVEYVKTRKQFGVPIGSFQAVQHRLAEAHLHCEALNALANFAVWSAEHSPDQVALASRSAIKYACEQGPQAIEAAIQLHGGIGFTWEYDLHLFLRRAKSIEAVHGGDGGSSDELLALVGG